MMPEMLLTVFILTLAFVWWSSYRGVTSHRETIQELIASNKEISSTALIALKAATAEEASNVKLAEQINNIRVKELEDALAENAYEAEKRQDTGPDYATTTDGRRIDLRRYDPI